MRKKTTMATALQKLADMSRKAQAAGGTLSWTDERSDDGGFILRINIPIPSYVEGGNYSDSRTVISETGSEIVKNKE